jgi:EAL domain-containing protein (putative c-di-GMP-specific phosphodiesterase class I)
MNYQPLVDAITHKPVYYEALVRISDAGGPISPVDIFPIIARRHLDIELDKAVLRAIESDLQSGRIPEGTGISVNVSGAMLALMDFCEYFAGLAQYLSRHPIIIEITETSFISHLQHASECLRKMRQNGFLVALDDFGSGYSSIRYLSNMPVDIVKFDISMVHDLNKDQRTRIIIERTAALIKEAGYKLVAEGIENAEILQRAEALGASHYQGFLFGRPQPLPQVFSRAVS